jgi:hypothetical protein
MIYLIEVFFLRVEGGSKHWNCEDAGWLVINFLPLGPHITSGPIVYSRVEAFFSQYGV